MNENRPLNPAEVFAALLDACFKFAAALHPNLLPDPLFVAEFFENEANLIQAYRTGPPPSGTVKVDPRHAWYHAYIQTIAVLPAAPLKILADQVVAAVLRGSAGVSS